LPARAQAWTLYQIHRRECVVVRVLSYLDIRGRRGSRIELWQGDLTGLAPDDAVDALLISAFPDDYTPTPESLIGALAAKGLSVDALARYKDFDIVEAVHRVIPRAALPAHHRV